MRIPACLALALFYASTASAADVFDRHTSRWIERAPESAPPVERLGLEQAIRLETLGRNVSSPCIVVRTNDGNWAKALVAWGFRKGPDEPIPVLLIERFVTYRGDREDASIAAGKDVMLFAGFAFNFDIGQVVPAGQGGDVEFTAESVLAPLGEARIHPLDGPLIPAGEETDRRDPNDHDGVLPRDFAGTWKVNVDGRWTGELQLALEGSGRFSGKYTSDESKSGYDVGARIASTAHHLKLQILLDNATQSMDAYLWTTDKSTMAGTATLANRTFGFYAVRVTDGKPTASAE